MDNMIFDMCFRCYYPNGNKTDHRQALKLSEIQKWIDCYKFTHPMVESITVKVWFGDQANNNT